MKKHERDAFEAIRDVLEPAGWKLRFQPEAGSKPYKCVVATLPCGRELVKRVPSSPRSDCQSTANFSRQWAQRVLRDPEGVRKK